MNQQQFNILKKHYDLLYSVAKTLTMMAADPSVIQELYDVYVGLGYRSANMRCNECKIGMMLTLYRLYTENKSTFEKPAKDEDGKLQTNGKTSGKTRTTNTRTKGNKKA